MKINIRFSDGSTNSVSVELEDSIRELKQQLGGYAGVTVKHNGVEIAENKTVGQLGILEDDEVEVACDFDIYWKCRCCPGLGIHKQQVMDVTLEKAELSSKMGVVWGYAMEVKDVRPDSPAEKSGLRGLISWRLKTCNSAIITSVDEIIAESQKCVTLNLNFVLPATVCCPVCQASRAASCPTCGNYVGSGGHCVVVTCPAKPPPNPESLSQVPPCCLQ